MLDIGSTTIPILGFGAGETLTPMGVVDGGMDKHALFPDGIAGLFRRELARLIKIYAI